MSSQSSAYDSVSQRAREITPFIVMDVLEAAQAMERAGEQIIHLEVGEPDFDTPECIKEAGIRAIREGKTHYTHSLGLLELREAICAHYRQRYRVELSPGTGDRDFRHFPGHVHGLFGPAGTGRGSDRLQSPLCLLSQFHPLCPGAADPGPGPGRRRISILSRRGEKTDRTEDQGDLYQFPGQSRPAPCFPPPGWRNWPGSTPIIISDEIYHGLVYEGQEHSILEFTDRAFVLNGFSKLYAMTGWRLGYLIAPKAFVRPLQKIHQNFFISANAMAQWAGIAALTQAQADVARMRETYDARRKFMIRRLKEIGFGLAVEPTGAFYVLANARKFQADSYRLAFDILHKAKVGVSPGIDFGSGGEGYLRFTYANSLEQIEEGLRRLAVYIGEKRYQEIS